MNLKGIYIVDMKGILVQSSIDEFLITASKILASHAPLIVRRGFKVDRDPLKKLPQNL